MIPRWISRGLNTRYSKPLCNINTLVQVDSIWYDTNIERAMLKTAVMVILNEFSKLMFTEWLAAN
jgi:hypothetical protein